MNIIPQIKDFFDKEFSVPAPEWFEIMSDIQEETLLVFKERWRRISGNFEQKKIPLHVRHVSDHKKEWYWLSITLDGVYIYAVEDIGVHWALTTLYLLGVEGKGILPCCEIKDEPVMSHRGFMLDVSRHMFTVEEIKRFVEQCSLLKLNRFHWHLSDDQGYRIESKIFPELNRIGSYREPDRYGGYYTHDEIMDIVSFASDRGVEVIPEIDLPGHTTAMIAAYPELSCSGEPAKVGIASGVYERVLCVGNEQVLPWVCKLLDEVTDLFPYEYFHIGGDEVPKNEWKKCPLCNLKKQKSGAANEEELQTAFTNQLAAYLRKKGKTVICWNDALKAGGLDENTVVQYWDEEDGEYCSAEVAKGRRFILSYTTSFYLNFMHALIPLEAVWRYDGKLRSGCRVPAEQMMGFEAPLWAEQIEDFDTLCHYAFPRLCAVAERAWVGVPQRNSENGVKEQAAWHMDFAEFLNRTDKWTAFLSEQGIPHTTMQKATISGEAALDDIADYWMHIYMDEGRMTQGYHDIEKIRGAIRSMMKDWYDRGQIEEAVARFDALMQEKIKEGE